MERAFWVAFDPSVPGGEAVVTFALIDAGVARL